ncbi:MAG: thioesterase family protein [Bacteroidales bacterium]|jgi:acyl-CoA thioester hydrolase|nr:thioesterase family protein [Bacteroidales bacterium]
MIQHDYTFRVKYSETDKMGIVHHSNYVRYFENARWELFRSIGLPYTTIEEEGYMFPVISLHINYIQKVVYDEKLTIHTTLEKIKGVRLFFSFMVYNQDEKIVCKSQLELACVNREKWKPCSVPEFIMKILQKTRPN